ncbi:hypothetical protein IWW47_005730, partial [Coemansia sp. RSA 2052]
MVFTSPDYFPFLARKFHQATRWDDCNSYATFCKTSQAILDFSIPYGLSVSAGRGVSNSLSSQLVFSMIPRRASSIGYLASSRPLLALPARAATETAIATETATATAGAGAGSGSAYDVLAAPVGSVSAETRCDISKANEHTDSISDSDPRPEVVLAGFSPSPSSSLSRSDTLVHAAANGGGGGDFAF